MTHAGGGGAASAVRSPSVHNRVSKAKSLRTERSISDDVPWNHPWIKFTNRNLLKGKTTIVKTTPYQCNTTSMYQGRGLLSPHDNLRPEFRNPGFIPNGLKALKREQTPWRNAHSCAQIIRIWCPVFTNSWSLVNGPLLRHILLMFPQHSSVTNTKGGQLAGCCCCHLPVRTTVFWSDSLCFLLGQFHSSIVTLC